MPCVAMAHSTKYFYRRCWFAPATIWMFYSQTLNFFILLLRLEKVAVAVCACLVHAYISMCLSSQFASSSALFPLVSSSTPVISSPLSCLTYHIHQCDSDSIEAPQSTVLGNA